jgi:hypothetical protein
MNKARRIDIASSAYLDIQARCQLKPNDTHRVELDTAIVFGRTLPNHGARCSVTSI